MSEQSEVEKLVKASSNALLIDGLTALSLNRKDPDAIGLFALSCCTKYTRVISMVLKACADVGDLDTVQIITKELGVSLDAEVPAQDR
jgi:hypothetical protein